MQQSSPAVLSILITKQTPELPLLGTIRNQITPLNKRTLQFSTSFPAEPGQQLSVPCCWKLLLCASVGAARTYDAELDTDGGGGGAGGGPAGGGGDAGGVREPELRIWIRNQGNEKNLLDWFLVAQQFYMCVFLFLSPFRPLYQLTSPQTDLQTRPNKNQY